MTTVDREAVLAALRRILLDGFDQPTIYGEVSAAILALPATGGEVDYADRHAALESAMTACGYSTEMAGPNEHYYKDERSRDFKKGWHAARSQNADGTVRLVKATASLPRADRGERRKGERRKRRDLCVCARSKTNPHDLNRYATSPCTISDQRTGTDRRVPATCPICGLPRSTPNDAPCMAHHARPVSAAPEAVDDAFYKLVVAERDAAWKEIEVLKAAKAEEVDRLTAEEARLTTALEEIAHCRSPFSRDLLARANMAVEFCRTTAREALQAKETP